MRPLDLLVIVGYLIAVAVLGLTLSARRRSATAYFVGERDLPWWAVCFSVVATETSTLTVISVPGLTYLGSSSYVELAVGYLIGRILVAFVLLPLYFRGSLVSVYQFLGLRFGNSMQRLASVTFVVTRLLAEGVRLFASAIPIKLLLDGLGVHASYFLIIVVLTAVTVVCIYLAGIRAVIWTDTVQLLLYVGGSVLCVGILLSSVGGAGIARAFHAGKLEVFQSDWTTNMLTNPYTFLGAVLGGAFLSMASHGADQLIGQRLLACRTLDDGRKAVIGSGLLVMLQFALFSLIGALLWVYHSGRPPAELGLASSDALFPAFILHDLPAGLSGLLIAGILAANMGSLSAALNSLSATTVTDLVRTVWRHTLSERAMLRIARVSTLGWAAALCGFAALFTDTKNQVIVLGLG